MRKVKYKFPEPIIDLFPSFDWKAPKPKVKSGYDYEALRGMLYGMAKDVVGGVIKQPSMNEDLVQVGVIAMWRQVSKCQKDKIIPNKAWLKRACKKAMFRESERWMGKVKLKETKKQAEKEIIIASIELLDEDDRPTEIEDKSRNEGLKLVADKEAADSGDMFQLLKKTLSKDDYRVIEYYCLNDGSMKDRRKKHGDSYRKQDKRLRDVLAKCKAILPDGIEFLYGKENE